MAPLVIGTALALVAMAIVLHPLFFPPVDAPSGVGGEAGAACGRCGAALPRDARFCAQCGAPQR